MQRGVIVAGRLGDAQPGGEAVAERDDEPLVGSERLRCLYERDAGRKHDHEASNQRRTALHAGGCAHLHGSHDTSMFRV